MLTTTEVYRILSQVFPEQNNFFVSDYSEELRELLHFGVTSPLEMLDLVSKHREATLSIDREPSDDFHIQVYSKQYGKDYVKERINGGFWFAYPALLRIVLELKFGDRYRAYADVRDKM